MIHTTVYTWSHPYLKLSQDGASVLIQGDPEARVLKYPAVTICPKISTKYAIAERLGNYIDPLNLPEELLSLRHDFLTCASGLSKRHGDFTNYGGYNFCKYRKKRRKYEKKQNPIIPKNNTSFLTFSKNTKKLNNKLLK